VNGRELSAKGGSRCDISSTVKKAFFGGGGLKKVDAAETGQGTYSRREGEKHYVSSTERGGTDFFLFNRNRAIVS